MVPSANEDDDVFKSIVEEEEDITHNTADDENQPPNYITDSHTRDDALHEVYVDKEIIEEGPRCHFESEGTNTVEIDRS
eukprot:10346987-Ditylum_brightwellii.AAC.1